MAFISTALFFIQNLMTDFRGFPLEYHDVSVAGRDFRFAMVRNAWELLDKIDPDEFRESEKMPYWAEIWPGSLVLSSYLVSHMADRTKSVLEIGAGVGVTSVVLSSFGFTCTATDYDEDAIEFMKLNASLNQTTIGTRFLDWTQPPADLKADLIVGSDIIYEVRNLLPILDVVRRCLNPGGAFYFSDPGRRPMDHFRVLVREAGYHLREVWSEPFRFRHATPTVSIYQLTVT